MTKFKKIQHTVQTIGEEIANSISHGIGTLLSIAAMVVLVVVAAANGSGAIGVVSAVLYTTGLILLYTFSSLYHSLVNKKAKRVFRIFDHCSIFLLIFSTYIPVLLVMIGGSLGWRCFGIMAFTTVLGVVLNAIDLERFKKVSMILYIVMGWSAITIMGPLLEILDAFEVWFLFLGGIFYTAGIIFYANHRLKYMHFIWHIFVLGGSVFHYFFILHYYLRG